MAAPELYEDDVQPFHPGNEPSFQPSASSGVEDRMCSMASPLQVTSAAPNASRTSRRRQISLRPQLWAMRKERRRPAATTIERGSAPAASSSWSPSRPAGDAAQTSTAPADAVVGPPAYSDPWYGREGERHLGSLCRRLPLARRIGCVLGEKSLDFFIGVKLKVVISMCGDSNKGRFPCAHGPFYNAPALT